MLMKLRFLIVIAMIIMLGACSTTRKDGPPDYYVDDSKVPDAIPKVEALSKYGNKNYYVLGHTYHVMNPSSAKNYEATGIASWYGTKFHAQRTSSGERYDMLAMTAAHKTLPLPTYVQVTNLTNGKKIIVKVNDRGPFESNRLIDLSYVAAKKLGMLGHGTAMVDVKAIDPMHYDKNINQPEKSIFSNDFYLANNTITIAHLQAHPTTVASNQKSVYLQVGAFKNKLLAEHLKSRLSRITSAPVSISHVASNRSLYRVQIGPIRDLSTAKNLSQRLRAEGLDSKQII